MLIKPAINIQSNLDENTLHPASRAWRDQQQDASTQPVPPGGLHCGLCGRLPGTQARAQATVLSYWLLWPTGTRSLWRLCTCPTSLWIWKVKIYMDYLLVTHTPFFWSFLGHMDTSLSITNLCFSRL